MMPSYSMKGMGLIYASEQSGIGANVQLNSARTERGGTLVFVLVRRDSIDLRTSESPSILAKPSGGAYLSSRRSRPGYAHVVEVV